MSGGPDFHGGPVTDAGRSVISRPACAGQPEGWRTRLGAGRWWFAGAGLVSFVWFLVRVIPKPSRAAYPCQRAAAPLAASFVLWVIGLAGMRFFWRRAIDHLGRDCWVRALACVVVAVLALGWSIAYWPAIRVYAGPNPEHGPIGIGRGIHPGRVVWVHAPEATDWGGLTDPEPWYGDRHTDLSVVEEMMSQAVRGVTGEATDEGAWQALFRHFNERRQKGVRGYEVGEKIVIKINLTGCNARSGDGQVELTTYEKRSSYRNWVDNSPQMLVALLRQLVYVAGVRPADISMGDPTGLFAKHLWDPVHSEFPEVRCFDNRGALGRVRTEFSSVPFYWSTSDAAGKLPDYVPWPLAEAEYLINFAVLKGHSCGVTVCAKNHYGSLLRCPDGYFRDAGKVVNYYDLHESLAMASDGTKGMGHYRALVDLMGHTEVGGKTVLYLVDGLFGGYYWEGKPYKWRMPPFGDGATGDWPSSLFASQDPVAIDSVAYDFLLNEWPDIVTGGKQGSPGRLEGGAEDYLHEAALASEPPSGTTYDPERDGVPLASLGVHEHWDNATDRRYGRNRGLDEGIELVSLSAAAPVPRLTLRRDAAGVLVFWRAALSAYHLESATTLGLEADWTRVSGPPGFFQAQSVVTNPVDRAPRFYRLAR